MEKILFKSLDDLIKKIGYATLCDLFGVTALTVHAWRLNGIPRTRFKKLRDVHGISADVIVELNERCRSEKRK